jgi:hypothetical protein
VVLEQVRQFTGRHMLIGFPSGACVVRSNYTP